MEKDTLELPCEVTFTWKDTVEITEKEYEDALQNPDPLDRTILDRAINEIIPEECVTDIHW